MLPPKSSLGALLAVLSVTTAAPANLPGPDCVVPDLAVASLQGPLTLSAFIDSDPVPWTVSLRKLAGELQPFITRAKTAVAAEFTFTNGKLSAGSDTAYFGPSPPVWPPYLDELLFGKVGDAESLDFYGGYSCAAGGGYLIQLRTSEPLVVSKVAEGESILGRAPASKEPSIQIELKVNGSPSFTPIPGGPPVSGGNAEISNPAVPPQIKNPTTPPPPSGHAPTQGEGKAPEEYGPGSNTT